MDDRELIAREDAFEAWCFRMALFDIHPPWEPACCRILRLVVSAVVKCVAGMLYSAVLPLVGTFPSAEGLQQVGVHLLTAFWWADCLVREIHTMLVAARVTAMQCHGDAVPNRRQTMSCTC